MDKKSWSFHMGMIFLPIYLPSFRWQEYQCKRDLSDIEKGSILKEREKGGVSTDTVFIPPDMPLYHVPEISERMNKHIRHMKLIYLALLLLLAFLGLNYRQLYSAFAIHMESRRLERLAVDTAEEYQNPSLLEDHFEEGLSTDFWNFSIINGAGKVSHADTWHAAAMTIQDGLNIHHIPDMEFSQESGDMTHKPAAEQYNNLTLIGGRGFRPTPSQDVVLQFSSRASENFYGTAGVIFQPLGTLEQDGLFTRLFDMFGFSAAGNESSMQGVSGALCDLALNWIPVEVNALPVDPFSWHNYEIRLHWINKTQWQGMVSVDGKELCTMPMPSFGPVEGMSGATTHPYSTDQNIRIGQIAGIHYLNGDFSNSQPQSDLPSAAYIMYTGISFDPH